MTIKEIYEAFDKIGCCTFATIDGEYPETRIAHFLAYDEDGIYFSTMNTKPFYKQLKETGKVSACGLYADTRVETKEDGNLLFDDGYFIRITGDTREVTIDEIKSKSNPVFNFCIEDNIRYPALTAFVIYRGKGEVYDYDYEKAKRNNKLERFRFSYGDFPVEKAGFTISDKCINCGMCDEVCSFDAIEKDDENYYILENRCEECGSCVVHCPVDAIIHKGK